MSTDFKGVLKSNENTVTESNFYYLTASSSRVAAVLGHSFISFSYVDVRYFGKREQTE